MIRLVRKVAALSLLLGLCRAQSLTPAEALDRYLAASSERQSRCSDSVFAVHIDAALPKLGKQGSMNGLKLVSKTGQIVYRGLRFTGDNLVKTTVIARFLTAEVAPREEMSGAGITSGNYSFFYDRASDYSGLLAFVFRLKPRRKRVGLFQGELWLDAHSAAALRLWGDFVKSPSILIRGMRFVQDYQNLDRCSQPLRLLLTVQTRIAGKAEMAVWLHPADSQPAGEGADGLGQ